MFATSPPYNVTTAQGLLGISGTGVPTQGAAVLDHVSLRRAAPGPWTGTQLGHRPRRRLPGHAGQLPPL